MPASAPSSSLKPFEWPPKFCTNCAPQSQRHAELPPRSCSRGRGPAIMQIARRGQNIVFVTACTRGNFSFSAATVRRRVGGHRAA